MQISEVAEFLRNLDVYKLDWAKFGAHSQRYGEIWPCEMAHGSGDGDEEGEGDGDGLGYELAFLDAFLFVKDVPVEGWIYVQLYT